MARVYYVGDWAVLTGPWFAETPFQNAMKGLEVVNYGHWLKTALESTGEHVVTSVPARSGNTPKCLSANMIVHWVSVRKSRIGTCRKNSSDS